MRASTLVIVALLAIVAIADDATGPGVGTFAPSDFVKQPTVAAANSMVSISAPVAASSICCTSCEPDHNLCSNFCRSDQAL